jgi:hypothetical protein
MAIPYQLSQKIKKSSSKSNSVKLFTDFSILKDKPFWIWDKQEHKALHLETNSYCCFNHIVGLPQKDKQEHPLYDYEELLFDRLFSSEIAHKSAISDQEFKDKHLWVLKSTGLGITEFFLRIIGWLCTKDDSLKGSQVCIVTGPRIELSVTLIDRLKALFYSKLGMIFSNKETVLELNGVRIEVYPSHHLDSMRGLANVSFILLDEADFFPPGQQKDARDISERYIGKSNPFIVMASTPNRPGSLFDTIEKENEKDCIYHRIKLDYTYGLGKIYTLEEIEKAMQSPSFKREYDLQFEGIIGNTFHVKDIDRAVLVGKSYDANRVVVDSEKILGLDPGWGSSAFGLVLLQVADGQIQILMADEFERPRYEDMTGKVMDIIHGLNRRNLDQEYLGSCKIYVDGSNPEFIISLKQQVGDIARWEYINEKILYCKKNNLDLARYMTVVPVPFSTEGKNMIMHTKELLEFESPLVAINPKFYKLITALRTATSDDQGKLNKEETSYDNVMDAFRLALKGINLVKKEKQIE